MAHLNLADFSNSNIVKNYSKQIIMKAMENEIQKGGEGSRGGKIIGHTKSGKPIYDSFNHSAHKDFNEHDHSDAADVNSDIANENLSYTDKEKYAKHVKHWDNMQSHGVMWKRKQRERINEQKKKKEERKKK